MTRTYLHIHAFNDVYEDLILRVLRQGAVKENILGDGRQCGLGTIELVALLRDVCFEHGGVGGLWITKVQHLIEQFIYNHKVVANRFLFHALEVLFEHLVRICQNSALFELVRTSISLYRKLSTIIASLFISVTATTVITLVQYTFSNFHSYFQVKTAFSR